MALARACAEMDLIGDLSSARLRDELVLLLDEPRISSTLGRLKDLGLQHALHPRLALDDRSDELIAAVDATRRRLDLAGEVPAWRARLVIALRDLEPEELDEWVARMKFRRRDAKVLVRAWLVGTRLARRLERPMSEADLYEIAHDEPLEALLVGMAVAGDGPAAQRLEHFLLRVAARAPRGHAGATCWSSATASRPTSARCCAVCCASSSTARSRDGARSSPRRAACYDADRRAPAP